MIDLNAEETLALARARAPQNSRFAIQLIHEAAILIPCALILSFALVWNDRAAMVLGPLLYAGYQIYSSIARHRDLRRLGEVIGRCEKTLDGGDPPELGHSIIVSAADNSNAAPATENSDTPSPRIDLSFGAEDSGDSGGGSNRVSPTPEGVAELFDDAAEETRGATRHLEIAARHFRRGKIPRGCAHAFAAEGNLRRTRDAIAAAASIHADRAGLEG